MDRQVKPEDVPGLLLLLKIGALCNDAMVSVSGDKGISILGDPTEGALVAVAAKANLDKEKLQAAQPRVDEIPFQSEKLYMVTLHPHDGRRVAYVKGATERLLSLSRHYLYNGQVVPLTEAHAQAIQEANHAMASEAIRVIATAYVELPADTVELDNVDLAGQPGLRGAGRHGRPAPAGGRQGHRPVPGSRHQGDHDHRRQQGHRRVRGPPAGAAAGKGHTRRGAGAR